jgi:hypothetical protein
MENFKRHVHVKKRMGDNEPANIDDVVKQLQMFEQNRSKDVGERLHDSIILIHKYLGKQQDRETAYRELRKRIQNDKSLDYIYTQI